MNLLIMREACLHAAGFKGKQRQMWKKSKCDAIDFVSPLMLQRHRQRDVF